MGRTILGCAIAILAGCGSEHGVGGDGPGASDGPERADARERVDGGADAPVVDAPRDIDAPGGDIDAPVSIDAPVLIDAPEGSTTIRFRITTRTGNPETGDLVLVSDNGGPWVPVPGNAGVHTFSVFGPRYVIARECRSDFWEKLGEANLYYLTVEDGTEIRDHGCWIDTGLTATVGGSSTGVPAGQYAGLGTGWQFLGTSLPSGTGTWSMAVPPGRVNLLAAIQSDFAQPVNRLLFRRNVLVTGTTTVNLDFATDGFDPVERSIIVAGTQGAAYGVNDVILYNPDFPYGASLEWTSIRNTYHAPPASRLSPGDVIGVRRAAGVGDLVRQVIVKMASPMPVDAALGPNYVTDPPTVSDPDPSYIRMRGTLPHVAGADSYQASIFTTEERTDKGEWYLMFSARWADGQPIEYEIPDLRGIGGWTTGLHPGGYHWEHEVKSSVLSSPPPGPLNEVHIAGDTVTIASSDGNGVLCCLPPGEKLRMNARR